MNEESRPARRLPDNCTAPSIADGAEAIRSRLGESDAFADELERLAELAPEPWAAKLRKIAAGRYEEAA